MEKITLMGQDLGDKAHLLWEMERSRLELARRMARGEELQGRLGALVGMQRDQDWLGWGRPWSSWKRCDSSGPRRPRN